MKIKVVVDKSNKEEWTYSVYHGFARPFILLPLYTEWFLDRKGMTAEELGKYLSFYMDDECVIKFPSVIITFGRKNKENVPNLETAK